MQRRADQIVDKINVRPDFDEMKRTKRVLAIVDSSTTYGRQVATGIARYVHERGHWSTYLEVRGMFEIPHIVLDGWDGDGIISRTANSSLSRILKKCNCPIVELLGDGKNTLIEVLPDERQMIELCVNHFLERGFKNLALYSFGHSWWIDQRLELFMEAAVEKRFIPYCHTDKSATGKSAARSVSHPLWQKRYEESLIKWLKTLPFQTGIIAAWDEHAMRVLQACQKIGRKVPEEIAVLGMDNEVHLCNFLTPQLSSLDRNLEQVGYEAARLLDLKMNRSKNIPKLPILIPPLHVVTRRSTDVTAIDDPDIAAALHYIREFAIRGIRVSDVVKEINLSRRTLIRQFQKILGRSPKGEITRVCLDHAKYLLIHTSLPINDVATQSGYSSAKYFVSTFRKHTGHSPLQFRRKHQISEQAD